MNTRFSQRDTGLGLGLSFSTILHLSVCALLTFTHFSLNTVHPEQVYYVDMVNLPVANPRAGNSAAAGKSEPAPAPPSPPPSHSSEMKLPSPAAKRPLPQKSATMASPARKTAPSATESAKEFEDRIARMERTADDRRQAAALDALRRKVAVGSPGRAGIPKGTGTQAGSDYASYIQSRLYEAFKMPKTLLTKNPEVLVQLKINRTGRIAEYRIEHSSGDRAFEDAVSRAVAKAELNFVPPPNNQTFQQKFVFKPDSIGKK